MADKRLDTAINPKTKPSVIVDEEIKNIRKAMV
jgi:hypothetical protein